MNLKQGNNCFFHTKELYFNDIFYKLFAIFRLNRFTFELFDFNLNASLSKKELIMMMIACICGINLLSGGGEELETDLNAF